MSDDEDFTWLDGLMLVCFLAIWPMLYLMAWLQHGTA